MRVLVADRSPLIRAVLVDALSAEPDLELAIDHVATAASLVAAVERHAPLVVLAGLNDGALADALAGVLRARARVLVVCDEAESDRAAMMLFSGASGCLLLQDGAASDVVYALREVGAGHSALHPMVAAAVLKKWRAERPDRASSTPAAPEPLAAVRLSEREMDVLKALARGLTTKAIGRHLTVSPKTVEAHISRIFAKLGARNRAQALSLALDRGLISHSDDHAPVSLRSDRVETSLENGLADDADARGRDHADDRDAAHARPGRRGDRGSSDGAADDGSSRGSNHVPAQDSADAENQTSDDGVQRELLQGTDLGEGGCSVGGWTVHDDLLPSLITDHPEGSLAQATMSAEVISLGGAPPRPVQGRSGAYGLHLAGLESLSHQLVAAAADWPQMTVMRGADLSSDGAGRFSDFRADYQVDGPSGDLIGVRVDREPLAARYSDGGLLNDDALLHPYLTVAATVASHWLSRLAFHAGAFLVEDGAWAILGAREAGKSSLLAHLAAKGAGVMADDLVILDEGLLFAGPRSIDLRSGAAEWLNLGRPVGGGGPRERWRVDVPPVRSVVPLRGWILPEWSDSVVVEAVPVVERLPLLYRNRALTTVPRCPEQLLKLAALPFIAFRRPRRWEMMEESAARLWDTLGDLAS